jgi:hypothetical protein
MSGQCHDRYRTLRRYTKTETYAASSTAQAFSETWSYQEQLWSDPTASADYIALESNHSCLDVARLGSGADAPLLVYDQSDSSADYTIFGYAGEHTFVLTLNIFTATQADEAASGMLDPSKAPPLQLSTYQSQLTNLYRQALAKISTTPVSTPAPPASS